MFGYNNTCLAIIIHEWIGRDIILTIYNDYWNELLQVPYLPPTADVAANCLRMAFHDAGTYVDLDEIFGCDWYCLIEASSHWLMRDWENAAPVRSWNPSFAHRANGSVLLPDEQQQGSTLTSAPCALLFPVSKVARCQDLTMIISLYISAFIIVHLS